jgi:hypothetical protein
MIPNEVPVMLTINETAAKTNLAKHYIRQCCLKNQIVHVRCGKRILINFNKFIEFLNTGDPTENEALGKIRRLS